MKTFATIVFAVIAVLMTVCVGAAIYGFIVTLNGAFIYMTALFMIFAFGAVWASVDA